MKHRLIADPVFRSETLFYMCKDGEEAIQHAKKKYKLEIASPGFSSTGGLCLELFNPKTHTTFWLVWVIDTPRWKAMVHESAHLVFRILDKRGVKYSSEDDETFCYLLEFFVSEFWHVMCK